MCAERFLTALAATWWRAVPADAKVKLGGDPSVRGMLGYLGSIILLFLNWVLVAECPETLHLLPDFSGPSYSVPQPPV